VGLVASSQEAQQRHEQAMQLQVQQIQLQQQQQQQQQLNLETFMAQQPNYKPT